MSKFVMDQGIDSTPKKYYMTCALTYAIAMVASNKALQWINYPTQVVGKSCKPIPVMILGVLFGGKRYPLLKYLFVFVLLTLVKLFLGLLVSLKAVSNGKMLAAPTPPPKPWVRSGVPSAQLQVMASARG